MPIHHRFQCALQKPNSADRRDRIYRGPAASRSKQPPDNFQQVTLVEAAFYNVGIGADIDAALAVLARVQRRYQHHRQFAEPFVRAHLGGEGSKPSMRGISTSDTTRSNVPVFKVV